MKVLSIRCSNRDYAFSVISGTRTAPKIETTRLIPFPKGFSEAEALKWFYQELETLLKSHSPEHIVIKAAEPMAKRSKPLESRLHNEGIVYLAGAMAGVLSVNKKVKSTIAKDLGLKGKGKYLETKLDTSPMPGFNNYSAKEREAILAGWSCLD